MGESSQKQALLLTKAVTIHKRNHFHIQTTKKMGCPASVKVFEIMVFNDPMLKDHSKQRRKREKIKGQIKKGVLRKKLHLSCDITYNCPN